MCKFSGTGLSRGAFLASGAALGVSTSLPALAGTYRPDSRLRVLWLRRSEWNEEIRVPFTRDGRQIYRPGYYAISWILRDHKVDPTVGYVAISVRLIEALWEVQQELRARGIHKAFDITSGYRTPETNAHTEGAAKNSEHMRGTAIDGYVEGVEMRDLFDIAWSRRITGGDGLYSDHIHIDVGERRWWSS